MKYFVYLRSDGVLFVSAKTERELRKRGFRGELLTAREKIQDCLKWIEKFHRGREWETDSRRVWSGHSAEGRKRLSEKMRGPGNPNFGGWSEEVKKKISRTMRGTRRGERNPMFGLKQRESTKALQRAYRSSVRYRWALDPAGVEHQLPVDAPLPAGWIWGRKRTSGPRRL